jgi:hypothetical protein
MEKKHDNTRIDEENIKKQIILILLNKQSLHISEILTNALSPK